MAPGASQKVILEHFGAQPGKWPFYFLRGFSVNLEKAMLLLEFWHGSATERVFLIPFVRLLKRILDENGLYGSTFRRGVQVNFGQRNDQGSGETTPKKAIFLLRGF